MGTYSAAISACEKGRQWELALKLLGEMQEAGVTPNVITYSSAISACEKGRQWELALKLLGEMQEAGLTPNVITYNAAISACEKGCQWELALKLLGEMKEAGVTPNSLTLCALMQAFVSASHFEEGFKLLAQIEAWVYGDLQGESLYGIYHILQSALRDKGDQESMEGARKVQKSMEELGLISKPAEARAIVSGKERSYKNSHKEQELNKIVDRLWRDMIHKPVLNALPLLFTERASEESQSMSLKGHAEKIALADLLMHREEKLHFNVNIR